MGCAASLAVPSAANPDSTKRSTSWGERNLKIRTANSLFGEHDERRSILKRDLDRSRGQRPTAGFSPVLPRRLLLQPQLHHRRQPHRAIWTNELKFHLGKALENGVTREASRRSASPMRRSR
jgi:hypothetical protein